MTCLLCIFFLYIIYLHNYPIKYMRLFYNFVLTITIENNFTIILTLTEYGARTSMAKIK